MPRAPIVFSDRLLTIADLVAKLRVSRATVWRMVAAGRLPDPIYPSWRSPRWDEAACDRALARTSLPPKEAKARRRTSAANVRSDAVQPAMAKEAADARS